MKAAAYRRLNRAEKLKYAAGGTGHAFLRCRSCSVKVPEQDIGRHARQCWAEVLFGLTALKSKTTAFSTRDAGGGGEGDELKGGRSGTRVPLARVATIDNAGEQFRTAIAAWDKRGGQ